MLFLYFICIGLESAMHLCVCVCIQVWTHQFILTMLKGLVFTTGTRSFTTVNNKRRSEFHLNLFELLLYAKGCHCVCKNVSIYFAFS